MAVQDARAVIADPRAAASWSNKLIAGVVAGIGLESWGEVSLEEYFLGLCGIVDDGR